MVTASVSFLLKVGGFEQEAAASPAMVGLAAAETIQRDETMRAVEIKNARPTIYGWVRSGSTRAKRSRR